MASYGLFVETSAKPDERKPLNVIAKLYCLFQGFWTKPHGTAQETQHCCQLTLWLSFGVSNTLACHC